MRYFHFLDFTQYRRAEPQPQMQPDPVDENPMVPAREALDRLVLVRPATIAGGYEVVAAGTRMTGFQLTPNDNLVPLTAQEVKTVRLDELVLANPPRNICRSPAHYQLAMAADQKPVRAMGAEQDGPLFVQLIADPVSGRPEQLLCLQLAARQP